MLFVSKRDPIIIWVSDLYVSNKNVKVLQRKLLKSKSVQWRQNQRPLSCYCHRQTSLRSVARICRFRFGISYFGLILRVFVQISALNNNNCTFPPFNTWHGLGKKHFWRSLYSNSRDFDSRRKENAPLLQRLWVWVLFFKKYGHRRTKSCTFTPFSTCVLFGKIFLAFLISYFKRF